MPKPPRQQPRNAPYAQASGASGSPPFKVQELKLKVPGSKVQGLRLKTQGARPEVQASRFRVQDTSGKTGGGGTAQDLDGW